MSKRVVFDFDITFTNGGGIQGQDFRLDIGGESITDKELADYIVWDMRLLMVGKVKITNKKYISESHKRLPISIASGEELIDLSHTVFDGLVTYKGLPAPVICDYLSREQSKEIYEKGITVQIGRIDMVANTGTYIDCPFHFFEEGTDLSEVPLKAFTGLHGLTIEAQGANEIGVKYFKEKDVRNKAVLIHTGWAKNWNTEAYFTDHPYVTKEAAEYLRECDVKLVGIDSHNIDDTRGKTRPVHSILLGADILIVEHMCNLDMLPAAGYTFHAVPPKVKGMGTFPVRAYAKVGR